MNKKKYDMENFIGVGNGRTYEDFHKQIPEHVKPKFDELRQFCLNLGDKLVEDVRMHRVVFCKSMTFRWFADLEPTQNSILIKLQKDRKIPITSLEIFPENNIEEIKIMIKDAYEMIH